MSRLHTPHPEQTKIPIVLSDFDYTLCHTYGFDPETNNHLPIIDPELADVARRHHLVVATGRRANHPALPVLWKSGLVDSAVPAIAENGGVLVSYDQTHDNLQFLDLVAAEDVAAVHALRDVIRERVVGIPKAQQLIFKLGRTMLVTRIQDAQGAVDHATQQHLATQLRTLLPHMQVMDTRVSVTVQPPEVTKWQGFLRYLAIAGIERSDAYVVGMGDGENDRDILTNADFSIGFSDVVRPWVDIEVPMGAAGAPAVLRAIHSRYSPRLLPTG